MARQGSQEETGADAPALGSSHLARLIDLIALALAALAVWSLVAGGIEIRLAGLTLSATDPARLLMEAFAIMLVGQLFTRPAASRWRQTRVFLLYAGLLAALLAGSSPRRVGDGGEYLALALALGRFEPPAMTAPGLSEIESRLAATSGFGASSIPLITSEGSDGRLDLAHFWLFPLLAAPLVRVAEAVGAHPNHGFTLLNVGLLLVTARVMLRRLPVPLAMLLLAGPIVWWTDKAHTEVFTFCVLSIAMLLLREAPWWSAAACGAAAAQNPALAPVAALFGIHALWIARASARAWLAVGIGAALAVAPILYYWSRLGRWSPLGEAVLWHWPNLTELTTVLWDPNLSILVHAPAFTAALAIGALCLARSGRPLRADVTLWLALAASALLLVAFAQTRNVNSGATPGPSRYGLWLLPLTIPMWRHIGASSLRAGPIFPAIAALSIAWTCVYFRPGLEEHFLDATRTAEWQWRRAPAVHNPLPEVFVERLSHRDGRARLPVATSGCEKVLLAGDGSPDGAWPVPCRPASLPIECARDGALCYANRGGGGYTFVRAPDQPSFAFERIESWVWRPGSWSPARRVLDRVEWEQLRIHRPMRAGSFITAAGRMHELYALQSRRALVVWIREPFGSPFVEVRVPEPMRARFEDPASDELLAERRVPEHHEVHLEVPLRPMVVLVVTPD